MKQSNIIHVGDVVMIAFNAYGVSRNSSPILADRETNLICVVVDSFYAHDRAAIWDAFSEKAAAGLASLRFPYTCTPLYSTNFTSRARYVCVAEDEVVKKL